MTRRSQSNLNGASSSWKNLNRMPAGWRGVLSWTQLVNKHYIFIFVTCLTCEFLAEWRCDGSCFDQRCLANVFELLDFGHAVVVDQIVVFFSGGEGSVDPVVQVFDAYVLVVSRRDGFHQLRCVLPRRVGEKRKQVKYVNEWGWKWSAGRERSQSTWRRAISSP